MIKNHRYASLVCILLLLLNPYKGYCQNDTSRIGSLSLKELLNINVSTVSKALQQLEKAPATVIVITREQIKLRGYQSLLDMIIDLPDIKLDDKIYTDSRNSVTIRGIQGQQNFIILLDGIKISSPTNEALPVMENYPVNLAEQVEIVYGPSSALYGADAVSGIINIISRKVPSNKDMIVDATATAGMYGCTNNTIYLAKKLNNTSNFFISGQYYYAAQPDYTQLYSNDPAY
ncbi:MAG: btuB 3, partial [Flavipsychrobacter sp.]|nr:btuB 3 [Flavipsychrobacter sp.]